MATTKFDIYANLDEIKRQIRTYVEDHLESIAKERSEALENLRSAYARIEKQADTIRLLQLQVKDQGQALEKYWNERPSTPVTADATADQIKRKLLDDIERFKEQCVACDGLRAQIQKLLNERPRSDAVDFDPAT